MDLFTTAGLYVLFARALVLFTSMPIHEYAHGWVAHKLGDDTAYLQGRLDFNPIHHLDPFGTILLLLTGFGWAKPVPVNPRNFNRKHTMRGGMAITALAGPVANIILALVLLLVAKVILLVMAIAGISVTGAVGIITNILTMMVSINVSLGVFNLLPIPPLDGYRIASYFIPAKWDYYVARYQMYIFFALFLILRFTPILDIPLNFLANLIYRLLNFLTSFIDVIARVVL